MAIEEQKEMTIVSSSDSGLGIILSSATNSKFLRTTTIPDMFPEMIPVSI
ncbi:hypothetical protein FPSE_03449 [Fusarium pseudograminearum CS3096]|uniref:Uncharacterized protein n=1 Tax=Fusarium pseudograminearum (strain CS3096) TaxID=1028729 RepID=K3UV08_FUSPC|nr:hypothetical protein FPSE_03449 [Fusarium pseudograminearum CS3096]EKJ76366.1 hypothetical protein FPSE_03449 [Fusarium pseudograminearum CS3096]